MLKVEILDEEITVFLEDGREVVHWTEDEWLEDPSITPNIANAVHLDYSNPEYLIEINQEHINSQS
jgi:hypothetical protein